jgi:hypothetical protein
MNDEIRTIKPEFKCVRINETRHYTDEIKAKFGKIYSTHLFNKNEATHLCSMTPSYCLHYLGTIVEFKNESDSEDEDLVNLRDELENESGYELADYYNCSSIDSLPAEDFADCLMGDDAEWATKEEYDDLVDELVEDCHGNPSW